LLELKYMEAEILENLKETLNKPVEKERVVYIMVEIRKFITKTENISAEWKNLKYWCDWVVHTRLSQKFANETLNKMEEYILSNPKSKFHHSDFNHRFISLEELRDQLYEFFKFNNLPTKITNIPPWDDFSKYLVETLRNCPLEKKNGLVRKFFFSKRDHISEIKDCSIDWELIFNGTRPNLYGSVLHFKDSKNR